MNANNNEVTSFYRNMNTMTSFYKMAFYAQYVLPIVFILVLITVIYMKFFYNKRLRWAHFSIMIALEPELRHYVSTISDFVRNYHLNASDTFSYGDDIGDNLYFYKTLKGNVIENKFNEAISKLEELNVTYDANNMETYLYEVEKFLNTRFSWTKADKFPRTESNKTVVNQFYNKLNRIANQETHINEFMNNSSLMNFLDFENLETEESTVLKNQLFVRYGNFLPNGNLNTYITTIMEERNTPNAFNTKTLQRIIDNNTDFFVTEETSVDDHINTLFVRLTNIVQTTFSTYYTGVIASLRENDEDNVEATAQTPVAGTATAQTPQAGTCSGSSPSSPPILQEEGFLDASITFPDDQQHLQEDLERRRAIYDELIAMKEYYDTYKEDANDVKSYLEERYIVVEKLVFEEFDSETNLPLFTQDEMSELISHYQSILDCVYVKTHPEQIDLATKFTIRYMLDDYVKKDERLEQLVSLYVSFSDLSVMERRFKEKLDAYNQSRDPDIEELKQLYERRLDEYKKYFIEDGISKQWNKLYEGRLPPRYYWTLEWLRKSVGNKSFDDIIKWLFKEHQDGTSDEERNLRSEMEVNYQTNLDFQAMNETGEVQELKNYIDGNANANANANANSDSTVETFVADKEKVVEHFGFFGSIGSFFGGAGDFFGDLGGGIADIISKGIQFLKTAIKIIVKLFKLITKPTEFLIFFVKIFLALLMIVFKLMFYLVKLRKSKDGVYLVGEFVAYNFVLLFFTVFNLVWFTILTVLTLYYESRC